MFNWEANTPQPDLRFMPAVIRFPGYHPLPSAKNLGEQLVRHRTALGMTQKDAAGELGVDPGALARWERDEREPAGAFQERLNQFLAGDYRTRPGASRLG